MRSHGSWNLCVLTALRTRAFSNLSEPAPPHGGIRAFSIPSRCFLPQPVGQPRRVPRPVPAPRSREIAPALKAVRWRGSEAPGAACGGSPPPANPQAAPGSESFRVIPSPSESPANLRIRSESDFRIRLACGDSESGAALAPRPARDGSRRVQVGLRESARGSTRTGGPPGTFVRVFRVSLPASLQPESSVRVFGPSLWSESSVRAFGLQDCRSAPGRPGLPVRRDSESAASCRVLQQTRFLLCAPRRKMSWQT